MKYSEIMDKVLKVLYDFAEENGYQEWCDGEEVAHLIRINKIDKLYLVLADLAKNHVIEAEGVDLKHEFIVEKVRINANGLRIVEEVGSLDKSEN
ncbi:MAG: hypothetical protein OHK0017_01810 [Patescibacteria group bacterium]